MTRRGSAAPSLRGPTLARALRAQLFFLLRTRRWVVLMVSLALVGLSAAAVPVLPGVHIRWNDGPGQARGLAPLLAFPPTLLIAIAWASIVWRGERPGQRDAYWALPVQQGAHELLRVAAGAAWLAGGIGALVFLLMLLSDAEGRGILIPWIGALHVTGALTCYLLTSAIALRSRRPIGWLCIGLLAWLALATVLRGLGFRPASALLLAVFDGRLGLLAALGGVFDIAAPHGVPQVVGSPTRWAAAMATWFIVALLLTFAAARPRFERRDIPSPNPRR